MKYSIANNCFRLGIVLMSALLLSASPFFADAKNSDPIAESIQNDSKGEGSMLNTPPDVIDRTAASPEDKMITERVTSALSGFNRVSVNTEDRVVTLMGTVPSFEDKQRALGLARNVDGVWTVKDELEIAK